MTDILFLSGIFVIAILYSSVGHGGASGYLAFMAVLSFSPAVMRPAALTLNILVSAIALVSYAQNGHFKFKMFWPFAITAVPMAYTGGLISIDTGPYKIILGIFLLFASMRMIFAMKVNDSIRKELNIPMALLLGAFLGFFSGLIGIGGGIILSPVILLLHWANAKQTAAISAAFILVNSLAGLTGFLSKNSMPEMEIVYMILAGIAGGLIGSYVGSYRIKELYLRYSLAVVLVFAGIKLIML